MAQGSELDINLIIKAIWDAKKHCYLPAISFTEGKMLRFLEYKENETLLQNRFKILEPDWMHGKEFHPEKLDLVLVPIIGFDMQAYRLGTGGGYYDRTFAFMQQNPRPKKPLMLGISFAQQQQESLPHDAWDVHLDGVLTEQQLIFFNGK
jgi:5-formyltetrahydrofolate cyclo-ligase